MFYDRKRMEVFTSTTEVSAKVEGDRHSRGETIPVAKVHLKVNFFIIIIHMRDVLHVYVWSNSGKCPCPCAGRRIKILSGL